MKKNITLVEVCINSRTKTTLYKPISDCIIAIVDDKEISVSDLLAFFNAQTERIDMLENKLNDLGLKYNALNAAYKANAAKTAMQLLDLEENN